MLKKIKPNFILIPFIVLIVAAVGGYFTSQGLNGWYEELTKPEWTPSGSFISAMWTFIYVLVASIVLVYFNKFKNSKNFSLVIVLFVLNAILNATWSLSFFTLNLLLFSFVHIMILNLTIIALIILLWKDNKFLSLGLLPYTAWVTIASVLNYSIFLMN